MSGPTPTGKTEMVALSDLAPNPFQPRLAIREEELDELVHSIKEHGFTGSIEVRHDPMNPQGKLQIVYGHRRVKALARLGEKKVRAEIVERTDVQMAALALLENTTQKPLGFWEEARAYQRLLDQGGYSIRKLAKMLGVHKGYIENRLKVLKLKEDHPVRQAAEHGDNVDLTTVITLVNLEDELSPSEARRVVNGVLSGNLKGDDLYKLRQARRGAVKTDFDLADDGTVIWKEQPKPEPIHPPDNLGVLSHPVGTTTPESVWATQEVTQPIRVPDQPTLHRLAAQMVEERPGKVYWDDAQPRTLVEPRLKPGEPALGVTRYLDRTLITPKTGRDWAVEALDQFRGFMGAFLPKMEKADWTSLDQEEMAELNGLWERLTDALPDLN